MIGLLRLDEPERAHRISSRAKKAAAFRRMSFSCSSRRPVFARVSQLLALVRRQPVVALAAIELGPA